MFLLRRLFLLIIVTLLVISTFVKAQDSQTPEPPTLTAIPTDVPTEIPPSETPTPTDEPTAIPTATNTLEPLPSPTATDIPQEQPTPTLTDTASPTEIPSFTPSSIPTATDTLEPIASPTLTLGPSLTASPTITLTPSAVPSAEIHNSIGVQIPQVGAATCNPSIPVQIASVSSSGVQGGVSGSVNSLTSDGRYLYFISRSPDLVANDTNNKDDVFQFDRMTCQTIRVSVGSNGEEGNGDSNTPAVSGNGRYLAFASLASNFVEGDTNNKYDIFVKDLQTGAITRVIADPSNAIVSYNIGGLSISDDGHYLTFDVVQNPSDGVYQGTPVLFDLQTLTRTVIASEGRLPTISGSGEFIAFVSSLPNLVNGDTNNIDDIFVYNRQLGTFIRASIATDGSQTTTPNDYFSLAISSDGRYISFTTVASFVSDDTNNSNDVYLRDTSTNQTSRISINDLGNQSTTGGAGASMSADGRYLVFLAPDGALVNGDNNGVTDLFVHDRQTLQTYRITNSDLSISSALISADGQYAAFNSFLTSADAIANNQDVFIAQRSFFVPPPASPTPTLTDNPLTATAKWSTLSAEMTATSAAATAASNAAATASAASCNAASAASMQVASIGYLGDFGNNNSGINGLAISNTGRYVAFISSATNLVTSDSNGYDDVFIFDRQSCQVTLVSKPFGNAQANNTTTSLAMSANGQIIAFASLATNLIVGDSNSGIFIRNLTNNTLIRIPLSGSTSRLPSISGDGRYVTYTDNVNANTRNIMLYDVQTNQSKLIEAVPINGTYSKISRDGSRVMYFNASSSLSIYTISSQQFLHLTVNMDPAALLDLSANGRYIAFGSNASDLVANDTNGKMDVFLLDQQNSQITRVSLGSGGSQISGQSAFPAISTDGNYVSFVTSANGLGLGEDNGTSDVYVYDRAQQTTYWISRGLNGAAGNNGSGGFGTPISENGQFVVFTSSASNLVAGDTGFNNDVFIAALSPVPNPQLETPTPTPTATAGASNVLGIGQYQENTPQLVYNGNWVNYIGSEPLGGSFKYTNDPNGKVNFSVNNTVGRIVFHRTTFTIYGTTQIYLDGAAIPIATMNNTSSTLLFGVPFTIIIPSGNHTIELRNIGSTYASIDQIDLLPPVLPLTVNSYQETELNLSYSGNWLVNNTPSAMGGSRKYTNDPNAKVSFKINSNVGRIIIYRTTYLAGVYGSFQVFVDGAATPYTTINNTSSAFLFQQPFTFAVTPGSHTIELRNVGSTYSDIDQITLQSPPATLGIGSYPESNPNLTYSGKWAANSTTAALGGSRIYTNDPNGSVTFSINNTVSRITIYRTTYKVGSYGSFQVFVDGAVTPYTTINNTSSDFLYQQPFTFEVAPGSHTIMLKNVGTTFSDIDQITLLPAPSALGIGSYPETDPELTYSGYWTPNSTSSALGGSRIYTNDPNGSVSFNINNSVGRVTIYRTTYLTGAYGSFQVFVDGAATPYTTINNTSSTFLFRQPFTFTVSPGNHTITLKNVSSTFSDIDQITLAAPTAPLSVGDYQETESRLIYNGVWTANNAPLALGNARIFTNDPNATVSFTIDNSVGKITIYRSTYLPGSYGSVQVFVDGAATPYTTINNTSPLFLYQQPFTFAIVPGSHTITLKNVGSTYSDLDQITLQPAPAAFGIGSYPETDPKLIYSGKWTSNTTPSALGSSRIYTNDPNGSVTFSINNTVGRVTIYRTTYMAGSYGSFQVFMDGAPTPYTTINNTSSAMLFQQPFTFVVTPGNHTITLKNVGATFSDLDQITLAAAATPLSLGDYQETESSLIYNGTWTANTTTAALGGSRNYTNDPNASVTFTIDGSVGKVTIYRTTYLAGAYGSMQVFLDNSPTPLTTISNTSSTFLFQQPFTFAVIPGNHTVTLKNVGTTYSDLDQITLAGSTPISVGDYQETEPNLIYNGTWLSNTTTSALGGSRKYTSDPNATVSFNIDNSVGKITIYRTTYLSGVYGSMQVFLDNSPIPLTTINNTSSAFLFQQPFTFAVVPGNHIITFKNVATTFSDIDQITLAAAEPLSVGNYQETEPKLIYNGMWATDTTSSALGGSRRYTNDPNATVSFSIDNSVGRITIYRTTYLSGVYGSFQVFVDGSATPYTTINNTSSAFLFQQPFSFTLTPGSHVITLKNVGSTYSDLDQITLTAS